MKKANRLFRIALISATVFAGWTLFAPVLARLLIVEKPLGHRADALFVLAGSATYRERTRKAAELFNENAAPRVLLTDDGVRAGWNNTEGRNTPFVELARRNLIENGVPAESIEILEPQVGGTIDEARLLRKKIAETDWKSVLLVTSAYHARRALRTFERANENVEIGVASAAPGEQTPPPVRWWLSSLGWNLVAGEYVKSVYYWLYY